MNNTFERIGSDNTPGRIRLIPFSPDHVEMFDLRPWDRKLLSAAPDCAEFGAKYFERHGVGYTATVNGRWLGAAGVTKVVGGTWEAWAYVTNDWDKYRFQIHRLAKKIFDLHFSSPAVTRIQCQIDSTYPPAVRWAKALGFKVESTMKAYGPEGQNFLMMARVK